MPYPMTIETVLPFSDFFDLLLAMLVVFVIVWAARIIYVIPILNDFSVALVLLTLFPTPALSLFTAIQMECFLIRSIGRPVCDSVLGRRRGLRV